MKRKSSRKKNFRAIKTHQCGSDSSSNISEYGHIDSIKIREKVNAVSQEIIKAEMIVKGKPIAFQLDSGASVNILNAKHLMGKNLKPSDPYDVEWDRNETIRRMSS